MKFGSLFSGVGGFDLGLERAGMECAWTVEYDKQARSVLRKQWPNVSHYEDVHDVGGVCRSKWTPKGKRTVECGIDTPTTRVGQDPRLQNTGERNGTRPSQLTSVDLICGGFPCQDYSVAGKRSGLVGDRGALWWQMHRIIAECRPTWVVGENVPGLLSSNGGRDFLTIVASLVELGYGVTWATLDSQYFGVAQRRRRLFIVGHIGGIPQPEILAISEGLRGHPAPIREAGERIAPSVTAGAPFARTGNERVEADAIVAQCLTALGVSTPQPRRLTPIECERLQGFPDAWTAQGVTDANELVGMADGPRYRMMGNAVTVNVAGWIGRRIMGAKP